MYRGKCTNRAVVHVLASRCICVSLCKVQMVYEVRVDSLVGPKLLVSVNCEFMHSAA